jgi:hypothetical protein
MLDVLSLNSSPIKGIVASKIYKLFKLKRQKKTNKRIFFAFFSIPIRNKTFLQTDQWVESASKSPKLGKKKIIL